MWLGEELQMACMMQIGEFEADINAAMLRLGTLNVRIDKEAVDLLNCLAVGPLDLATMFANAPGVPQTLMHGIVIPTVSASCDAQVTTLRGELQGLADDIGSRLAFEAWLMGEVETCVMDLQTAFEMALASNMNQLPAAQSSVDTKLAELKEVIGTMMESDDAFRQRMRDEFDPLFAMVPPGVTIVPPNPDITELNRVLPAGAAPSAVAARAALQQFYDDLVENLTFAMWLMDKKQAECQAIDAMFDSLLDSPRRDAVDDDIIRLLADLKVSRANSPLETDSAFGARMRQEMEDALTANSH